MADIIDEQKKLEEMEKRLRNVLSGARAKRQRFDTFGSRMTARLSPHRDYELKEADNRVKSIESALESLGRRKTEIEKRRGMLGGEAIVDKWILEKGTRKMIERNEREGMAREQGAGFRKFGFISRRRAGRR